MTLTVRMPFGLSGKPNWLLPYCTFHAPKTTWLSAFVESKRRSALTRSLMRKVRAMDAFRLNWPGPVIESRPALPNCPGKRVDIRLRIQKHSGLRRIKVHASIFRPHRAVLATIR